MAQYIDKDIIVAELKHRIKECDNLANAAADNNLHNVLEANELLIRQYTSLLDFLDTLETKDMDEIIKTAEDHAYFAGSENAREKLIDKACVWLMSHINDYLVKGRDIDYMFDDFRKAMEDE